MEAASLFLAKIHRKLALGRNRRVGKVKEVALSSAAQIAERRSIIVILYSKRALRIVADPTFA